MKKIDLIQKKINELKKHEKYYKGVILDRGKPEEQKQVAWKLMEPLWKQISYLEIAKSGDFDSAKERNEYIKKVMEEEFDELHD